MSHANANKRVTRVGANRTLTCLEAIEQGFQFIKSCSGCDYYSMNHKINLIAMKKPRSELSRYWQCSTPHKYGELTTSSEMKTPYWPPFESKYSILVGSDWGANASSPKRVRLFTPSSSGNSSKLQIYVILFLVCKIILKMASLIHINTL